jgi:PII-like signaling protein
LTFMPPTMDLLLKDESRPNDELPVHVQCVDEQENIQNVDMDIWYKFQAFSLSDLNS